MSTMYADKTVFENTFDWEGLPEYLRQAQWAEFIELKKIIDEKYNQLGRPLHVLDIGVGDGRLLKHLVPIEEIWSKIETYHAIDNTQECIDSTRLIIDSSSINNKVILEKRDALTLEKIHSTYDLIITTWFTAGNFYPDNFPFETYTDNDSWDLNTNEKFTKIFTSAYNKLKEQGEIVIGSIYKDNPETRKKQEHFYTYFKMEVITSEKDSFTATREGFWSQRFTPERVEYYLSNIPKQKFAYTPLDTYEFAMMVRIKK